jgi:hypothetical protein
MVRVSMNLTPHQDRLRLVSSVAEAQRFFAEWRAKNNPAPTPEEQG